MLTKDDLKQIREIVVRPLEGRFDTLEQKVDSLAADVSEIKLDVADLKTDVADLKIEVADIKLETKGIHVILERHEDDFRQRIERLEEDAGIASSS